MFSALDLFLRSAGGSHASPTTRVTNDFSGYFFLGLSVCLGFDKKMACPAATLPSDPNLADHHPQDPQNRPADETSTREAHHPVANGDARRAQEFCFCFHRSDINTRAE